MITYRNALTKEHRSLTAFLLDHGANPWNHLPEDGIRESLAAVAQGNGEVLLACDSSTIVGLCIFFYPSALPQKYQQYAKSQPSIYVSEVTVHRDYAGQGIGFELLRQTIAAAEALGAMLVLIDRHEENLASAGMMRKAGFAELRTFVDLERRNYGSRKTTVMGYQLR